MSDSKKLPSLLPGIPPDLIFPKLTCEQIERIALHGKCVA
jgi:hypothetical protein